MTRKEQKKEIKATIAAHEPHKIMAVKMTADYHAELKSEAKAKGMILSAYVLGLIKSGHEKSLPND